jgi:hypothetical protein
MVIVAAVGNNLGFEGKPYAAKLCSEATAGGKDDWYLSSKEEADVIYGIKEKFAVEEGKPSGHQPGQVVSRLFQNTGIPGPTMMC